MNYLEIYFASGTVLKPSDEPYNLRSKITQANQELANDTESKLSNVPGKVKFDNTVVVLDSFEDVGMILRLFRLQQIILCRYVVYTPFKMHNAHVYLQSAMNTKSMYHLQFHLYKNF